MKPSLIVLCALLVGAPAAASDHQVIPLWNGPAPGSEGWSEQASAAQPGIVIRNITVPSLTVYSPDHSVGTGVIVVPGSGFVELQYGAKGTEIARWLNTIGVTAFVLKHRTARTDDLDPTNSAAVNARIAAVVPMAEADIRQALTIVRQRAHDWHLDPQRIGIMGFESGGYMAVRAGWQYQPEWRPAFVAGINAGSLPDPAVPADAPPVFLALSSDNERVWRDDLTIFTAWQKAHRPVEMHIYARGGSEFALRKQGLPVDSWNERLKDWMMMMGFLPAGS